MPVAGGALAARAGNAAIGRLREVPDLQVPQRMPDESLRQVPSFDYRTTIDSFDPNSEKSYVNPRENPGVANSRRMGKEESIARGKQELLRRIEFEGRVKGVDGLDPASDFLNTLPDKYLENLGSSFYSRGETKGNATGSEARVLGRYLYPANLLQIFEKKVQDDVGGTYVHELWHHLEQFIPEDDYNLLIDQWRREFKGSLPFEGQGSKDLAKAQLLFQKLENKANLSMSLMGNPRPPTPDELDLMNWSPNAAEAAIIDRAYRWNGGFHEWLAESMKDRTFSDLYDPKVTGAFARVKEVVRDVLWAMYNFFTGRGERDAASRVYKEIKSGKYDTSTVKYFGDDFPGEPLRPDFPGLDGTDDPLGAYDLIKINPTKVKNAVSTVFKRNYGALSHGTLADIAETIAATDHQVGNGLAERVRNATPKDIPVLSKVLNVPVEFLKAFDPRAQYSDVVLKMRVAQENFLAQWNLNLTEKALTIQNIMDNIRGENSSKRIAREAISLTPAAAGISTALLLDDELPDWLKTLMIVGSVGATGVLNRHQKGAIPGLKLGTKYMQYPLAAPKKVQVTNLDGTTSTRLVSPSGANYNMLKLAELKAKSNPKLRLAYMMAHPEDYVLPANVLQSFADAQKYIDDSLVLQNQVETMAGKKQTPMRAGRGAHQFVDWDKFGKMYETEDRSDPLFTINAPEILTNESNQMQRTMGDDVYDLMWGGKLRQIDDPLLLPKDMKFPDIPLAGDLEDAMIKDLIMRGRSISGVTAIGTLFAQPEGNGWVDVKNYNKFKRAENFWIKKIKDTNQQIEDARKAGDFALVTKLEGQRNNTFLPNLRQRQAQLGAEKLRLEKLGWAEGNWEPLLTDIPNQHVDPEVVNQIKKMWPEYHKTGFVNHLDDITKNIRQVLFSGDFSAWVNQGMQLAANDPISFIRSSPALLTTSLLGESYTAHLLRRPDFQAKAKRASDAGVVNGAMIDDLTSGESMAKKYIPGLRQVEHRGFQQFLPMARILQWDHMVQGEALWSKFGSSKLLGYAGGNDVTQVADMFIKYGLPVGAVSYLENKEDIDGWQELFAIGLAGAWSLGASKGLEVAGNKRLQSMTPQQRRALEVRVARQINRTSGVLHRGQLAINSNQARNERTFLANSPAFLRNTFSALKVSMQGTGEEAAAARAYLVKTAILSASLMAGWKFMMTGEMDSLNPWDDESVLNPKGFAKVNLGEVGKFSAAHPLLGLIRSVMTPFLEKGEDGEEDPSMQDMFGKSGQNFIDTMIGRTPILAGKAYEAANVFLKPAYTGKDPREADNYDPNRSSLYRMAEGLRNSDSRFGEEMTNTFVPLPLQPMMTTLSEQAGKIPGMRDDFFLSDPNINNTNERYTQIIGNLLGINSSPETLSQEAARREDILIRKLADSGILRGVEDADKDGLLEYSQLDQQQKDILNNDPEYLEVKKLRDDAALNRHEPAGREEFDPVQNYLDASSKVRDSRAQGLRNVDVLWEQGKKREALALYHKVQNEYSAQRDIVEKTVGAEKVKGKTVIETLNANPTENEKALEGYYRIFDQAQSSTGELDFDKLEKLQNDYLKGLDTWRRQYVEKQLASATIKDGSGSLVKSKFLDEYKEVKQVTKPYWEATDTSFEELRKADPYFAEFKDYGDFRDKVAQYSREAGVPESTIFTTIRNTRPIYKKWEDYNKSIQNEIRRDPKVDTYLWEYYGRAPLNPLGIIARRAGSNEFDKYWDIYAARPDLRPTAKQIEAVARYYNQEHLAQTLIDMEE